MLFKIIPAGSFESLSKILRGAFFVKYCAETVRIVDELLADYQNRLADIELGKNLQEHFIDVSQCIHQLNELIDSGRLLQEELDSFIILAYHYYRLKEQLVNSIVQSTESI